MIIMIQMPILLGFVKLNQHIEKAILSIYAVGDDDDDDDTNDTNGDTGDGHVHIDNDGDDNDDMMTTTIMTMMTTTI